MRIGLERLQSDPNSPQFGLFSTDSAPKTTDPLPFGENTNPNLILSIKQEPIGKPAQISGKSITDGFHNVIWSPQNLVAHIESGRPFCVAQMRDGYRKTDNFIASNLFALDIDASPATGKPLNQEEYDRLLDDPFIRQNAWAVIQSFSSEPNAYKCRVLFKSAQTLTSATHYKAITRLLAEQLHADTAATDAARNFFGGRPGRKADFTAFDNVLDLTPYLNRIKRSEEANRRPQMPSPIYDQGNLSTQIAEALRFIPPHPAYHEWLEILMAVYDALPNGEGIALLQAWSPEEREGEIAQKFRSFARSSAGSQITVATLFWKAMQNGYSPLPAASRNTAPSHDITDAIIETLLRLHKLGKFMDHAPAALMLKILENAGDKLTITGIIDHALMQSCQVTEKTIRRGMDQLIALGFYQKIAGQVKTAGRPLDLYERLRLDTALFLFGEKLRYRAFEKAFGAFIPAAPEPEWFVDLDPEDAAQLARYIDDQSQELYRNFAPEIATAQAEYQRLLRHPIYRTDHLLYSDSTPLDIRPCRTGRDFREAYYRAQVEKRQALDRAITTLNAAGQIGVSPRTLTQIRDRSNVVTDAQFLEMEILSSNGILQQINDLAPWTANRPYGRYLESSSGRAVTVRPDSDNLDQWTANELNQGHTVIAKVQTPSKERFTTPEEVAEKRAERQLKHGGHSGLGPLAKSNPTERPIQEVLPTFPSTYRPDWIMAQIQIRQINDESIRSLQDLFPLSTVLSRIHPRKLPTEDASAPPIPLYQRRA